MAIRIADGKEIKIGTCNEMFFCRYDQWNQIHYDYMKMISSLEISNTLSSARTTSRGM